MQRALRKYRLEVYPCVECVAFDQSQYSISARDRTCRGSAIIACTMDEEKLIEAVHGFPCLWQVSCKGYKDARAKENACKVSQCDHQPLRWCNRRPQSATVMSAIQKRPNLLVTKISI